jgi:hypothetical protein
MSGLEIALVAGIASAVVGAVGTVSSGLAAKAQADTEAKVLRQQADYQRQGAEAEAKDFRERQSRLMAARRASWVELASILGRAPRYS